MSEYLFDELCQEEEMNVEGGLGPIFWTIVGVVTGWVLDGVLESKTGKSGSEHVADAISSATPTPHYYGTPSGEKVVAGFGAGVPAGYFWY